MKYPSPEAMLTMNEKEFLDVLDKGSLSSGSRIIRFYVPSFMYY